MNSPSSNPQVQQLLSQLADIQGLQKVSWWPLAPGWWGLLATAAVLIVAGMTWKVQRNAYKKRWQYTTQTHLRNLAANLTDANAKDRLSALSALLRRIAIHRFSREVCAGLEGSSWLAWLTKNDPERFNWNEHANLLLELPYAPSGRTASSEEVRLLINATRNWVK